MPLENGRITESHPVNLRPTTNSNGILGRVAAATSLEANVDTFLAAFQTQLNAETCP